MCIISYYPAGVAIDKEALENGARANDDGHGWAVASAEFGFMTGKSMSSKIAIDDFIAAREKAGSSSLALFHSRIATHGTVNVDNVHPFDVPGHDTLMAHNGILPTEWHPPKDDKRSDTRLFAEDTLPGLLTETGLPSRRMSKRIGQAIGIGNKFVILTVAEGKPKARIINANSGVMSGGAWYSNTSFKRRTYYGGGAYGTGYTGGFRRWGSYDDTAADRYRARTEANREFSKQYEEENGTPLAITAGPNPSPTYVFGGKTYSTALCEFCYTRGYIDIDTMICEQCDVCADCYEGGWITKCVCHGDPADEEAMNENAMFEAVQAALAKERAGAPVSDDELAEAYALAAGAVESD